MTNYIKMLGPAVLPLMNVPGSVIWVTGLSGAGKSTLAVKVAERLREKGRFVVMLDGDELREVFGAVVNDVKNHSREGRLALSINYAHLCQLLARQGVTVVIATISLFEEIHAWNRENLPGYFEVYLKVPMEELRRRDPKGIYRAFDVGELRHVAGLDLVIDEPAAPDCIFEFNPRQSVEDLANELITVIQKGEE